MARNGSGTYSLPTNSWNPALNGVPATAADWQTLINDVAAALTQSLSRDGQTPLIGNLPAGGNKLTALVPGTAAGDSLAWQQLFSQGLQQDLASAAVTDIGAVNSTLINVTGTTTITSFGTQYNGPRYLRFAGVVTLTHGASLILPGAANITTAAGDSCIVVPNGTPANGWRVAAYVRAADAPGSVADNSITFAKIQNIASGAILGRSTGGTGDVEALTGAQATALLSAASDTVSGRVELATAAETQTGTDATRAVTPAGLAASVLGIGQTWQDVGGSRAANTNYTNSTGRAIFVLPSWSANASNFSVLTAINGTTVSTTNVTGSFTALTPLIVPPGAVYRFSTSTGLTSWFELR